MKFSESWLREWVNPVLEKGQLEAQLTMAGLEVDGVEPATDIVGPVVVAEIVAIESHPNADKLRVCQVDTGDGAFSQVVCGAPNARAGIRVPFAKVGAVLPGDFGIEAATIRSVPSDGMLCGQTELRLGEDDEGLWELPATAPVGMPLAAFLGLDDDIVEVDLTPNRGDCLSVRGLAREVGVLNGLDAKDLVCPAVEATIDDSVPVIMSAPDACARYVGRVICNLDLARPTPLWMQEKLRRSGVRCLGAAVDVTNYIMLELGQPMHAFDRSKIDGAIQVRMGSNERLTLLDGTDVQVDEQTLVIADTRGPLALAGIMGGLNSAVSDTTCDIFLESAWFNPLTIAGKARAYGKHTDSSHRFERGVDPDLPVAAVERATALLIQICGGDAGPLVMEQSLESVPQPPTISLRNARLTQQLGLALPVERVQAILERLGLEKMSGDALGSMWKAPTWRFDLTIEQDLIEEIARIYGYNNLPTATPSAALPIEPNQETRAPLAPFREQLVSHGYREVITYSFVDPDLQAMLDAGQIAIAVNNPIASDMAVMRTNLWCGLLRTAMYNINRQQTRVRLFESGQYFRRHADGIKQRSALAGLIYGPREASGWNSASCRVDFFDIKGDVEALMARTGREHSVTFEAAPHSALHPGQSAVLKVDDAACGWLGCLHPKIANSIGFNDAVYLFQIDLDDLLTVRLPRCEEISKYPEVRRDLAFFVGSSVSATTVVNCARGAAGSELVDIFVFDVYADDEPTQRKKSFALALIFQNKHRTLREDEIAQAVEQIVIAVSTQCDGELRG